MTHQKWCIVQRDGHIFFEKSAHLYEYIPDNETVRLVGAVGEDENIELIWVESN